MKKIFSTLLVVVLLFTCLGLFACGKTAGEYEFNSFSYYDDGVIVKYKVGDTYEGITLTKNSFSVTLKENGKYSFIDPSGEAYTGDWIEEDGIIYSNDEFFGIRESNKLTIFVEDDCVVILEKK